MATEFYRYYNVPSTLPEFNWKRTTSVRTNWSKGGKLYGTVLQKKAWSITDNDITHITNPYKRSYPDVPWGDAEALKEYVLRSGAITEESAEEANIDLTDVESLHGIVGVIISGNTDKKYSMATNKMKRNYAKLRKVQGYGKKLDDVVKTLQDKGASDANIIDILNNKTFADEADITVFAKGIDKLPDDIAGALTDPDRRQELEKLDIWDEISSSISATDSQSGDTWGGTASEEGEGEGGGTSVSGGVSLDTQPTKSPVQVAKDQLNILTGGDPTSSEGLDPVLDDEGNPIDGKFTDAEGKTVTLQDGKYLYEDGTPYISPDQSTVATSIEDAVASSEAASKVVDEAVQQSAEGAQTASNINAAYTGGAVDEGVANALGWNRNVLEDGTVQFTDPRTNSVYTLGDDGKLTDSVSGEEAYTQGMINFEEYDFAGDYEDIVNNYLFGNTVSTEEALRQGYTQNEDGSFTGPNGQTYEAAGGMLQDVDGTPLRTQGFTDYQADLEGAAQEYTTQMGTLRGEYQKAFGDFNQDLRPRLQQLDDTTAGLTEVARDAADQNYYGRLQDVYFADAAEGIQSDVDSARDTLQTNYAASGADPNSPAYTAAIMDLQNKRGDAMRSARRQALLDSYSLGGNMLANRTNALTSAQSGIVGGMNALGSLYDVRIKGLDVDKDMISTIYQGQQNQAAIGVSGLNTIAQQQQGIVEANRNQFNTNLGLRTGLNTDVINAANTTANVGLNADANATNKSWKGMDWMQSLIDNDFNWQATGAALKTQFPEYDFKGELDPKFYNQLFPNG